MNKTNVAYVESLRQKNVEVSKKSFNQRLKMKLLETVPDIASV